ncbi:hypothetical protein MKX03_010320 [Papaver bracteatum]|nr:hypothetical protein MKX03_010320 [Papaver bracteatum]
MFFFFLSPFKFLFFCNVFCLIHQFLLNFCLKTPNQVDAERELLGKTIKVAFFPADVYLCALKMQSDVVLHFSRICNMKILGCQFQSSIKG